MISTSKDQTPFRRLTITVLLEQITRTIGGIEVMVTEPFKKEK
jgi:hypothetical protein